MCCFLNRSISKRKILLTQLYAPIPRGRGIRELVGGDKVRRTRRFPLVWRKPERDHRYSALVQGVYHEDRVRAGNCCGLNGYTGSLTQNPEWIRDAIIKENPVKSGFLQIIFTPLSPQKFLERISFSTSRFQNKPPSLIFWTEWDFHIDKTN